jgi:OOP family OmpA-OmpF porin
MLTAIRDFVHDSFGGRPGLTLDGLRVGDLTVYIAQGPRAILAGVVRGTPPRELRVSVEEALEAIHFQHAADLESFQGDAAPFEAARPILEGLLSSGYRPARKGVSYGRWIVLGVIALAAIAWFWSSYQAGRQWRAYVDRLQATPGIVVVDSGRQSGRYHLVGLRDPLAPDPQAMLSSAGIPPDRVDARWELYQAVDPAIVLERAKRVLRPPDGVTFQLRDGALVAVGAATALWIGESERLAPMIAGISRYDPGGLVVADLKYLRDQIQSTSPTFEKGSTRLAPGEDAAVRKLASLLDQLDTLARPLSAHIRVEVTGHTDTDGSDTTNQTLSQARAEYVLSVFRATNHSSLDLSARGVSGTAPLTSGTSEADKRRNRRVSVRVVLPGDEMVHP